MIKKIATTIEMSFDIPDSEKKAAEEVVDIFEKVIVHMDAAKKHLNDMYEPFKTADSIPPEELEKIRGQINRYKQQIKQNFEEVKLLSGYAMAKLNQFSSDTHIMELENTFNNGFDELETQVNIVMEILNDIEVSDFKERFIAGVESVRTESFELEKLVKDRIIDYIDTNILAKNWMEDVQQAIDENVQARAPYITQLFRERQKALGNT